MLKSKHTTFFDCGLDYQAADIVIFGAPFDSTTSFRPGTRMAAATMRLESFGLETYSPDLDLDLADYNICDAGDLELPFGNSEQALDLIAEQVSQIAADHKIPLMIGGEHLVSLGAIRALHLKYPDLAIIHFDAHTDLREAYLGQSLSHASVMRLAWQLLGDGRIWQFGIRSGERHEFEFAAKHTHLCANNFDDLALAIAQNQNRPIYLSIDLDILDPSFFPGTGTPEAGGVCVHSLFAALKDLSKLNIIGCDINELAPNYDLSGASTAVANKVLRELLLNLSKNKED